jgi:hypothetical protein
MNPDLFEEAERFHESMGDNVGSYVDFYRIIGDLRYTVGYIKKTTLHTVRGMYSYQTTEDVVGDGVVPLAASAYGANKTWYTSELHDNMAKNGDILNAVHAILQGNADTGLRTDYVTEYTRGTKITIYHMPEPISGFTAKSSSYSAALTQETGSPSFFPDMQLKLPDGSLLETRNGEFVTNSHKVGIRTNDNVVELLIEGTDEFQFQVSPSAQYSNFIGVDVKKMDGVQELNRYLDLDLTKGTFLTSRDSTGSAAGYDNDQNGSIDEAIVNPADPEGEDPVDPGDSGHADIRIGLESEIGSNGWRKSPVSMTIVSSIELPEPADPAIPPANEPVEPIAPEPIVSYQINNGAEQTYAGTFLHSEQRKHQVTAMVKDPKGKLLGEASRHYKIDTVMPDIQALASGLPGENGWLLSDSQVSVTASDETSKLASVKYAIDGSPLLDYNGPSTITAEGIHSLSAQARDHAGWVKPLQYTFKIDKSKPVISDVYLQDEYYWGQTFPIRFMADDAVSGIQSVKATLNGKEVIQGGTYMFTEPGWHTYRIEVKDFAGWRAVYETRFEVYIPARINFDPDHLQLDHGTGMTTLMIQLPDAFEPQQIRFSTVETNGFIPHVQDDKYGYVQNPITDSDDDGIMEMMLKYERESLVQVIPPEEPLTEDKKPNAPDWALSGIVIFGEWDQYHFKGYDRIVVSNKDYVAPPPDVTAPAIVSQPVDGSTGVTIDANPVITFSESIYGIGGSTLTELYFQEKFRWMKSNGESVSFTANWMKNTFTVQLNPVERLEGSQLYTIEVPGNSITDAVYNPNAAYRVSFTTEPYTVVYPEPLPMPVIQAEPDISLSPPTMPVIETEPDRSLAGNTDYGMERISSDPSIREGFAMISDGAFEQALKTSANQDHVVVEVQQGQLKLALSYSQWNKVEELSKPVKIRFPIGTLIVEPKALPSLTEQASYYIFTAEKLDQAKDLLFQKQGKPDESLLYTEPSIYHFQIESYTDEGTSAVKAFMEPVQVEITLDGASLPYARSGSLKAARYNEMEKSWELYEGSYVPADRKFQFKTKQFSHWTLAVQKKSFPDIGKHWGAEEIELLYCMGVIDGYEDGRFRPDQGLTRAEFTAMLVKSLGLTDQEEHPFDDVRGDEWYALYIEKAFTAGIISGVAQDRFSPHETITREQIIHMINTAREHELPGNEALISRRNAHSYRDHSSISAWAAPSIEQLTTLGIVEGDEWGMLRPRSEATRSEAVALLVRYLTKTADKTA